MTRRELIDNGYKPFKPSSLKADNAIQGYQKQFVNDNGDTLYFITVYEYDDSFYGLSEHSFEANIQLYQRGTHNPLNLSFFCGWDLKDVERFTQNIYDSAFACSENDNENSNTQLFEPYERG